MDITHKKNQSINKNFFYNLLYEIIIVLSPLIVTPYVSRVLGVDLIGVRSYTYAILTYFELFSNLGIAIYGQREIARVVNDKQSKSNVFLSLIFLKIFSFFIVSFIYCGVFFGFNILSEYKLIWLIWIIHLSETVFNITWYFQGCEKFKLISIRGIILRITQIILTLLLIKGPDDFYLYLVIYATIPFLQAISLWPFLVNDIQWSEIKRINLKKHIKNIFIFFIPTIATTIYSNIDKIMLGSMLETTTQVGYYESAQSIALLATTIFTSIYTVMRSRISIEISYKKEKNIDYFTKLALFVVISVTFGILAISNSFIIIFYGVNYKSVIILLRIFCLVIFLMGISGFISAVYIVPYDKQKYISIFYIFATILNIILNSLLIPKFEAIGAIVGTIVAEGTVFVGCLLLSRKNLRIMNYIKFGWKYACSGLIMFISVYILDFILPNQLVYLLCEIFAGIIVFLLILIILKDDFIMDFIKKRI